MPKKSKKEVTIQRDGDLIGSGPHAFYSFEKFDPKEKAGFIPGLPYTGGLYQSTVFQLIGKDNQLINQWCGCKDYISDEIWCQVNNLMDDPKNLHSDWGQKSHSIYGVALAPQKQIKSEFHRLDFSKPIKLALRSYNVPNFVYYPRIQNSFKLLQEVYKYLGLKKPKMLVFFGNQKSYKREEIGHFVFELPNFLYQAPPLISLTLLILRAGYLYDSKHSKIFGFKNFKDYMNNAIQLKYEIGDGHDDSYLKDAVQAIEFIKKHGCKKIFSGGVEETWPIQCVYHYSWITNKNSLNNHFNSVHSGFGISHMAYNYLKAHCIPYYKAFTPSEAFITLTKEYKDKHEVKKKPNKKEVEKTKEVHLAIDTVAQVQPVALTAR